MSRYAVAILLLIATLNAQAQTCTTTISVGANVATTVSGAAAGSTVCLNSGSYGNVTLSGFTKSPRVTVRSTTGQGATVGFTLSGGVNGITISSITANGMSISGSTTRNITIQDSNFGTTQFDVNTLNFNANNILIDNNYFGKYDATGGSGKEGRLSITWSGGPGSVSSGVVVTNNTFEGGYPGGCSDGVHLGSYGVVVGPGNRFLNIAQGSCGPHVDAIQGYGQSHTTVTGNLFTGNTVDLGFYDGGSVEIVTNNVIIGGGQSMQMGSISNPLFEHNTVSGATVGYNGKPENGNTTNLLARNNILINGAQFSLLQNGTPACTNCTVTHNQFASGGSGTDIINGAPTFIGGSNPGTNWAGWQLASGSIGENAGTDGQDMGTLYYGVAQAPDTEPPSTPTNLSATPASATQINLSWTASTDNVAVGGYNVRRCSGAACTPTTIIGTAGTNSYSSTGLSASTLYRYTVQAYDTASPTPLTSSESTVAQATTNAPAQVTVTPSIVLGATHGTIAPSTPQSVTEGTTTQFTVTPASGHKAVMGGTCGGNLAGTTYTTNVIAAACSVQASFMPTSCVVDPANSAATNVAMTSQTGTFTYLFSVIPAASNHDLTLGHTNGNWTAYTSYSTTVRFADNGIVDVRNGAVGYVADVVFPYSAGTQYNVRMVANVATDTYNVYIAADGQAEVQIASNYAFRTLATSLNNFAYVGLSGSPTGAYACPSGLSGGDTTAPTVQARRVVASGNSFELDLDEPSGSVSGSAGLTLSATGGAVTVAGCSTASDIITCSTSRQILGAETVTASYSGAGGIADTTGNPLASFSAQAVTNNSTQALVALSLLTPPDGTRYRKEVSSTTIGLTTSKSASCRRASSTGIVWASMTPYTTTGATSHSSNFPVVAGGGYRVCSRCLDTAAQQYSTDACTHFSVRSARKR